MGLLKTTMRPDGRTEMERNWLWLANYMCTAISQKNITKTTYHNFPKVTSCLISSFGNHVYRPALTTNAGARQVDDGIRSTSLPGGT